jgi:hypothetical protein
MPLVRIGTLPPRVSTEFRRHGIPRNFLTSEVISAQFRIPRNAKMSLPWTPYSQPLSRQRVFPSPPETGGRRHTGLRVGGWGESQFRRGAYTVVLFICTYFVPISCQSIILAVTEDHSDHLLPQIYESMMRTCNHICWREKLIPLIVLCSGSYKLLLFNFCRQ